MKKAVGILGFGYVAKFFASKMLDQGYHIKATSRSMAGHSQSDHSNLELFDFTAPNIDFIFKTCPNILISTPPARDGEYQHNDPFLAQHQDILKAHQHNIRWLGYLSATSVYGDHDGAWVNEQTSPQNLKNHSTGHIRLMIENELLIYHKKLNLPIHIFRLAGIYGPDRNAIERLIKGKDHTIFEPNQFFSRVHVTDLVNVLAASIQKPTPGEIFNVCDDEPAPSHEVDEYAAQLIGVQPPQRISLEKADLSEMGQGFYKSNKRVSNQKIKDILSFQLIYPSYREGLSSIYKSIYHQ